MSDFWFGFVVGFIPPTLVGASCVWFLARCIPTSIMR